MRASILGPFTLGEGGGDERERPPIPQPDATAETLKEIHAALQVRHDFEPGALVIYKRRLDPRPPEFSEQPLLYVDDDPDEYAELRVKVGRADVVIATALLEDGTAAFIATDSRFLEPWPRPPGSAS